MKPFRESVRRPRAASSRGAACCAALALFAGLGLASCGGGGGSSGDGGGGAVPPPAFDRNALLGALGERVILPTLRDFVTGADALQRAAAAYAVSGSAADRAAARAAWRDAMVVWQRAELYQVGPAASPTMAAGGQGLRDRIYSWPTVSPCRVDEQVASGAFADPGFFDDALVNVVGLDALEYLLFNDSLENACPSRSDLNEGGVWDALGGAEVERRRRDYGAAAAADLAARARGLRDAWEPTGGGFLGQLAAAGAGGNVYASAQQALDQVFAGIFYIELDTKDMKLAVPAGVSPDCPTETCPDRRESLYADASLEHVLANLRGFQRAFLGGEPAEIEALGFDDALVALGVAPLAERMAASTAAAIAQAEAIDGTLAGLLATDPATAVALHDAVKILTDDLKTQFVSVLGLRVPQEGAGDND